MWQHYKNLQKKTLIFEIKPSRFKFHEYIIIKHNAIQFRV